MDDQRRQATALWILCAIATLIASGAGYVLVQPQVAAGRGLSQEPTPVFVDEIVPIPPTPTPGPTKIPLFGNMPEYLGLYPGLEGARLVGNDARAFEPLELSGSVSPVKFYYQKAATNYVDKRYPDGIYDLEKETVLAGAVSDMIGVLRNRMPELMACGKKNALSDIPDEYALFDPARTLATDSLSRDLELFFFDNDKDVHVAIGAFALPPQGNAYLSGVTFSALLSAAPEQAPDLSAIGDISQVLIGLNLNTNATVWSRLPRAVMAREIFHEILHNFNFHHTTNGVKSNDPASYRDRSKAILALADCMGELLGIDDNAKPGVAQPPRDTYTALIDSMGQAGVQTQYDSEARAFAAGLVARLAEFQLTDIGITEQAMRAALQRPDAGLRINATVEQVWGDWLPYGPTTVQSDPATQNLTPFRVLVIRLIQGRQFTLTSSEQLALHNLLTRPDPTENWRNEMGGIVGAINRESFQTRYQTGNAVVVDAGSPQDAAQESQITDEPQEANPEMSSNEPIGNAETVTRAIQEVATVTDFENFGSWERGDETWGTFTRSSEERSGGQYSGKLAYDFPASPNNYVVFRRSFNLPAGAGAVRAQVYGDGSRHFLNAWIRDAKGQLWQFTFGRIEHSGWQEMTAPFDVSRGWPNQAMDTPEDATIDFPVSLTAIVLDGHDDSQASSGAIYLDALDAVVYTDGAGASSSAVSGDAEISAEAPSTTTAVVQQPANAPQKATVTAATLNVRSGPGASHGIVGKVKSGDALFVLGRSNGWLQVAFPEGPDGTGWVAEGYVQIESASAPAISPIAGPMQDTSDAAAPAVAPTNVQTDTAVDVALPPVEPAPATSAPSVLVTGFEQWGNWRQGDETWGTFTQSGEQVSAGTAAGKLDYAFPAGAANNYVVFLTDLPVTGQPSALQVEVYGDGSTNFLNAWTKDANGSVWQFTFGRINHNGWQTMTAPLDPQAGWPNQLVSGEGGDVAYPLRLTALVLDGHADVDLSGTIYLDELTAVAP